jgi:hypothetical protein
MSELVSGGFAGHCLCGRAGYVSAASGLKFIHCHCRDCQYISGGQASAFVVVPRLQLAISDAVYATYTKSTDAGNTASRHFCPECGTHLFSEVSSRPGLAFVKAGTMNDSASLKLDAQVWCSSAQPWVVFNEQVPKVPAEPSA